MKTFDYTKSHEYFKRACKVVPGGIYGHQSPAVVIPGDFPYYIERGEGSHFWDADGNEFIDYMCAYGPMVLGYNYPKVEEAVEKQRKLGNCFNAPSHVMVELAELMVDTVTIADWAMFAKNGGDMTNFSTMIARAHTNRKKIIKCAGAYHGVEPWHQALGHAGVIEDDYRNIIVVPFNDVAAFKKACEANDGDVAGFIMTPYHHPSFADSVYPKDGYWEEIVRYCKQKGIVVIIDDVRCGFRMHLGGSNEFFGFKPDLICFCKALGNCYPISAIVGTEEMKNSAAKVFHTGSYWFSAVPMVAAISVINELKELDGIRIMKEQGEKLEKGMQDVASQYGYKFKFTGHPALPYVRFEDEDNFYKFQIFCAEATKRGAYFHPHHNWFVSVTHTDEDLKKTFEICDEAFKAMKAQLPS